MDEGIKLVRRNGDARLRLAKQGNDGLPGVTSDNGDHRLGGIRLTREFGHKSLGPDHVKCGDAKDTLGVEDARLLEDLGSDRDGGVDWIGDDEKHGLGTKFSTACGEILDDPGIDVEEVVTRHAGLP